MYTVQIIQLSVAKQHETLRDNVLQTVATALRSASSVQAFTIGTEAKDDNAIQVVIQDSGSNNDNAVNELLEKLSKFSATPPTTFHLTVNNPPFPSSASSTGPLTAPVVEYVQSWFPASKATPAFRQQIEQDFIKFKDIFDREAKTDLGRAYGWVDEEVDKDDVEGGKASGFIVMTGWQKMEDFEASVATESFKEAIPILYAWGAAHRMWFVERKAGQQ